MVDKFKELKFCFNTKLAKQRENLSTVFSNPLNNLKKETSKQNNVDKQCKHIEFENTMFKQRSAKNLEVNRENQVNNEELEQYGRCLFFGVDGVPIVKNEPSDDVLKPVKSLFREAKVDIPGAVVDRAHTSGLNYLDKSTNINSRNIIVRCSTFQHRTIFY